RGGGVGGGFAVRPGLPRRSTRLFIIGLAALTVAAMYWLLFRTSRGLTIRAVTQNRAMSACLGVRAGVVDAVTFGLGAGLAGIGGGALPHMGHMGPPLGPRHIPDSFMGVVTRGGGKGRRRSLARARRRTA